MRRLRTLLPSLLLVGGVAACSAPTVEAPRLHHDAALDFYRGAVRDGTMPLVVRGNPYAADDRAVWQRAAKVLAERGPPPRPEYTDQAGNGTRFVVVLGGDTAERAPAAACRGTAQGGAARDGIPALAVLCNGRRPLVSARGNLPADAGPRSTPFARLLDALMGRLTRHPIDDQTALRIRF